MKISVISRESCAEFLTESRARGKDLAEVLDRAGVLLTRERKQAIEASVLTEVADLLATTSAHQWTTERTQMDLMGAIAGKLHLLAADRRKGS